MNGIGVVFGKNRSAYEIKFGEIDYVNDEVMRLLDDAVSFDQVTYTKRRRHMMKAMSKITLV